VSSYLSSVAHAKEDKSKTTKIPINETIDAMITQFDTARQQLNHHIKHRTNKYFLGFKVFIELIYVLLSIPILALVSCARPLNPLLRKIGIKNHFLPVDM
jgi:hypothetical protein